MSLCHIFPHMMVAPFESFHIPIIQHYFMLIWMCSKWFHVFGCLNLSHHDNICIFVKVWASVH
jgi:hypothetical protein